MNASAAPDTGGSANQRGFGQLVALLGLMRKARMQADPTAFAFLVVNETRLSAVFRQAALWRGAVGGG